MCAAGHTPCSEMGRTLLVKEKASKQSAAGCNRVVE